MPTIWLRGISTSMFFRLWTRAPRICTALGGVDRLFMGINSFLYGILWAAFLLFCSPEGAVSRESPKVNRHLERAPVLGSHGQAI